MSSVDHSVRKVACELVGITYISMVLHRPRLHRPKERGNERLEVLLFI
jgi:hypothetical protein